MNKKVLISLLVSLMTISVFAQKDFGIKQTNYDFLNSKRPALTLSIPLVDKKLVDKEWAHYTKSFKPEKYKTKKKVMIADNATILSVSNNPIDIYVITVEKNNKVDFYAAVDFGNAFLTSADGNSYEAMKSTIRSFAIKVVKNVYDEKLKEQNKLIEELSKEIEVATEDKQTRTEENVTYQENIENNEKAIEQLTLDIDKKLITLEDAKAKLEKMKSKAAEYF